MKSKITQKINVFKVPTKKGARIEYSDKIKAAVLDPRITLCKVHVNGGYDWIDTSYEFLKLLIRRGQILEIETHSDLLARTDYLDAIALGVQHSYSFQVSFTQGKGKGSFASEKRLEAAREKWIQFVNSRKAA